MLHCSIQLPIKAIIWLCKVHMWNLNLLADATTFEEVDINPTCGLFIPFAQLLKLMCLQLRFILALLFDHIIKSYLFSFQLFVECSGEEDDSTPFTQTQLHKLLDRYENTI